jgi:hypothetical protein
MFWKECVVDQIESSGESHFKLQTGQVLPRETYSIDVTHPFVFIHCEQTRLHLVRTISTSLVHIFLLCVV